MCPTLLVPSQSSTSSLDFSLTNDDDLIKVSSLVWIKYVKRYCRTGTATSVAVLWQVSPYVHEGIDQTFSRPFVAFDFFWKLDVASIPHLGSRRHLWAMTAIPPSCPRIWMTLITGSEESMQRLRLLSSQSRCLFEMARRKLVGSLKPNPIHGQDVLLVTTTRDGTPPCHRRSSICVMAFKRSFSCPANHHVLRDLRKLD